MFVQRKIPWQKLNLITCIFSIVIYEKYVQLSENTPVVAQDHTALIHCRLGSRYLTLVSYSWIYGLQLLGFRWYNKAVWDL